MHTDNLLTLSANCKNNPSCIYLGDRELFIQVHITNNTQKEICIPFAYIKKTGPFITLKDNQTGRELPLRRNLANEELLNELTVITPTQTISLDWVIFSNELEQLRHQGIIDVQAVIRIKTSVHIENEETIFIDEKADLHIKDK